MSEKPRSRGGAPVGSRNALKSGHYARKAALADVGFAGIDKRTVAGRQLAERREQIFADLGGRDSLSEIQLVLVEKFMRSVVLVDSIDNYLFSLPSLVHKRRRACYPVVRERAQLVDSALRLAQALGLEKRLPAPKSLADYMRERERNGAAETAPQKAQDVPVPEAGETHGQEPTDAASEAGAAKTNASANVSAAGPPRDDASGRFLLADDSQQPEAES